MAESHTPQEVTAPSQKRPLEEPSSPSGPTDGPDAKRPALDKVLKEDGTTESEQIPALQSANGLESPDANDANAKGSDGVDAKTGADSTDKQGDTVVPDAPVNGTAFTNQILETQPVQSTHANGYGDYQAGSQGPPQHEQRDETGWLHVRAIISSAEAATVIGKGGENVSQIRRMAGAKCTVSEYSRGAVERILTVSGLVDAVAKVSFVSQLPTNMCTNLSLGFRPDHPHP